MHHPSLGLILLSSLLLFHGIIVVSTLTNPYLIPPLPRGATQYLVFHSELRAPFAASRARCIALGGDLVDVDSVETLSYLAARLHNPAYIVAFLGNSYHPGVGECAAAYPGAAVAVPEANCDAPMESICEVPLLGSGSIHFADGVKVAVEGGSGKAEMPAFFRVAVDRADAVQAAGFVTTHVTIHGSIETNPALPCCKCCE